MLFPTIQFFAFLIVTLLLFYLSPAPWRKYINLAAWLPWLPRALDRYTS